MSVNLLVEEKIVKLSNTLAQQPLVQDFVETTKEYKDYVSGSYLKEEVSYFIARAVYYGYVANRTAYNVQYRENEPLSFELEGEEDFDTLGEAVYLLSSLVYNCYTNDGNCFLQDAWMNVLQKINKTFEAEAKKHRDEFLYWAQS